MAMTSKNFAQAFVEEYARSVAQGERTLPPALRGMIAPTGYFDPSQVQDLFAKIQQVDPTGAQAAQMRTGDIRGVETAGMGAGDTLSWQEAADEGDWLAPVMAIAGPVAGGYFNGAFSGLGGAESLAGGLDISGGLDGLTAAGDASLGVNPQSGYSAAEAMATNDLADMSLGSQFVEATGLPYEKLIQAGIPAATAASVASSVAKGMGLKEALQAAGVAATVGSALGMSGAAKDAAALQAQSADAAIAETRRQYDLNRADNAPFLTTGTNANKRLGQLLGTNPADGSVPASASAEGGYGSLLRRFDANDLNADPVYQSGLKFGLDEGTKGINSRAVQMGNYDSGATLKALTRFGNDYASTKGNESYNRYNNDQSNIYSRLTGQSGAGQTAVNQNVNAGNTATGQINDLTTGAGNARAAGIVGGANAWGQAASGLSGIANNYSSNEMLERILRERESRVRP